MRVFFALIIVFCSCNKEIRYNRTVIVESKKRISESFFIYKIRLINNGIDWKLRTINDSIVILDSFVRNIKGESLDYSPDYFSYDCTILSSKMNGYYYIISNYNLESKENVRVKFNEDEPYLPLHWKGTSLKSNEGR